MYISAYLYTVLRGTYQMIRAAIGESIVYYRYVVYYIFIWAPLGGGGVRRVYCAARDGLYVRYEPGDRAPRRIV